MVTVRIQLTAATALASPRPAGVAFEFWLVFDLFFLIRNRRLLDTTKMTVCPILIRQFLNYEINCITSKIARHYLVHVSLTIKQLPQQMKYNSQPSELNLDNQIQSN